MLVLLKIAVTGGLASGKTTVCRLLKANKAYILSADDIAHRLLSPDKHIGKQVLERFGPEILHENTLDRKKIAEIVFNKREELNWLEHLIHPAIINEIKHHFESVKNNEKYLFFVVEIPLLYEIDAENFFNFVIAVIADDSICQDRYQQTAGKTPAEWRQRMARQLPQEVKAARADFTIINNGSIEELQNQVTHIIKEISSE